MHHDLNLFLRHALLMLSGLPKFQQSFSAGLWRTTSACSCISSECCCLSFCPAVWRLGTASANSSCAWHVSMTAQILVCSLGSPVRRAQQMPRSLQSFESAMPAPDPLQSCWAALERQCCAFRIQRTEVVNGMQDMRMDRESPLVTELSPDDPSFPLLSQHSPSASRRSRAAPAAAAPASQQPSSSSSSRPQAASAVAASSRSPQNAPLGSGSIDEPRSNDPGGSQARKQPAQPSPRERLEPLESNELSGEQQPDIRLPSASAKASTSSGEVPVICSVSSCPSSHLLSI